jgi:hypothetical protein
LGPDKAENSSIVYSSPMDLLHLPQMGRKLLMSVSPPLLSGLLWPHSKEKGVMTFSHHVTRHLCLKSRSPQ